MEIVFGLLTAAALTIGVCAVAFALLVEINEYRGGRS